MTTKEYLGMMLNIDRRIKRKIEEAQEWRDIAESKGNQDFSNDRVQASSPKDMMAQAIVNAITNEEDAAEMALKLTEVKMQAMKQLDGIENETHYNFLILHFLKGKTVNRIAVELDLSYRSAHRYFNSALAEFEKKYGHTYLDAKRIDET